MADCALQESSKLISRKIWVMQKSWSFHTVCLQICSIWNTSKAVLYHWDNAFLTLCCKSQNVFDSWTTQIYGFYCTSSSYQLHCPPCNIMPPGVVNWNPRKESRHSRNFFRGYNCYFANSKFWNQQTINQSNLPEFGTCKGTGQDIVRDSIERQK